MAIYSFGAFPIHDGINYFIQQKVLDAPSLAYAEEPIARIVGVKKSGERINERPITVTVKVISTGASASRYDLEAKIDALMGALQYRQQRLCLNASDARYFLADCTDAKITLAQDSVLSAIVTMTFTAYSPYAFAASPSSYTMASVTMSSLGGGAYAAPQQAITGTGNVFSNPTLVLTNTGSVQSTTVNIYQQTDGMQLSVIQNMNAGDTLTIYCDPLASNGLSVLYNNTLPINFAGAFPPQEPTLTLWQIMANAASAPSVSCVWTWNARFAT